VTAARGEFAQELGILFQIVDDILDVTGSEEETGKHQGSDERLGKRTYVSVFGLERARELARDSHDQTRAALARTRELLPGETMSLEQISDFVYLRES
jgi:geranylgeranyl diphosphate synthase, type II